jgi:oligopeptide transport system substrate-binding protein
LLKLIGGLFAFAGAMGLTGCSEDPDSVPPIPLQRMGGDSGSELAATQVLHLGNGADPQTLDPHRAEGVPASDILRDLFEGLTSEAPDGRIIPGAAESWSISKNGLQYTFRLRADARWSNGDPVVAGDFVYGLRRSVEPATLSKYSSILYPIVNAESIVMGQQPATSLGVEAIDDLTLVIRLTGPTPYFLELLNHSTTYPVHRTTVEKYGARFARAGNLIGNGAYRLEEWVIQSHIRLKRNEFYWDNANTTINTVNYYPIENQASELKRYRADELDITEALPYNQLNWIEENLGDELTIAPYLGSYYFAFNLTRPPFQDQPKLRKAFALAVDRKILVERITGAGEIPAYAWVPQVNDYTSPMPDWATWTQEERNAAARRLYKEAGYSEDRPLTVEILYNTNENHKRISVAISSMWKQVLGVKTRLVNQEWKVFLATREAKETTEVFRAGWIGDYNDAYTFAQLMHSGNELNASGYSNPAYDELLDRSARTEDRGERARLMGRAEAILLEDLPIIPLYFYVSKHLVKPWVGGYQTNIMDHHYTKNFYILKH